MMLALNLALVAKRDVTRATLFHEPIETRIIVGEHGVKLLNRKPFVRRNGLLNFHGIIRMPQVLPDVKGYLPLAAKLAVT
jgi:hypothetical protein